MNKQELEDRLIEFAARVIDLLNDLNGSKAANHIAGQLLRSGTSPALNYGESRSAESRKDFIHKLQIVLKELRETQVALKIIRRAKLNSSSDNLEWCLAENSELIAIFVKTIQSLHQK